LEREKAMKSHSSHSEIPEPTRPECAPALEALQRRLDGESTADPDDVVRHRQRCADCRSREAAAQLLQDGVRQTIPPPAPGNFTDSVLDRVLSQPARRRRRRIGLLAAALALAASVVIAVFIVEDSRRMQTRVVVTTVHRLPTKVPDAIEPGPPSLRDSLNEAGAAVAALTRKTADESILARLQPLSLPKMSPTADPLERLEPAVASLEQVRHGAVFGVAPIANSAKRAADMFLRELGPTD
jgi:hypothetical protein